jgi:hypothetical protein
MQIKLIGWQALLSALLLPTFLAYAAPAPDIKLKLACYHSQGQDANRTIFYDNGEIHIQSGKIREFRWESALHRRTHGFDCSIDQSDQLELAQIGNDWRVSLKNGAAARLARGFDNPHGLHCLINLTRQGNTLHIQPSCPALCGSRADFSEFSVHLPSGRCEYKNLPK